MKENNAASDKCCGPCTSGSCTFISTAGQTTFADTSTAANATQFANGLDFGSAIFFEGDSTGGTVRVEFSPVIQ